MPDKEGSDDEKKSTKSVVNKKQKQMMGEEGYDVARDMGRVNHLRIRKMRLRCLRVKKWKRHGR